MVTQFYERLIFKLAYYKFVFYLFSFKIFINVKLEIFIVWFKFYIVVPFYHTRKLKNFCYGFCLITGTLDGCLYNRLDK